MPVKHAILGIIKEAPRHGYELKSISDARIGIFGTLITDKSTRHWTGWKKRVSLVALKKSKIHGRIRPRQYDDRPSHRCRIVPAEADVRWLSHVEAKILAYART